MNRERTLWLATGLLLTSVSCVVLGAFALAGFASTPDGDLAMTATTGTTNLLLAGGAILLAVLEFAHIHRRPVHVRSMTPASQPINV
jgi:hypothetical protein